LKLVEKAEEDLYRSLGIKDVHMSLPRIEIYVRYRSPLRWGDRARVSLWLEEARRRGMRYGFKIYNVSTSMLSAEGYVVVACVRSDNRSLSLIECPEELFDAWKSIGKP
jgi:acyl-CoA thioester hydrolase